MLFTNILFKVNTIAIVIYNNIITITITISMTMTITMTVTMTIITTAIVKKYNNNIF